jgi:hypothetical protein
MTAEGLKAQRRALRRLSYLFGDPETYDEDDLRIQIEVTLEAFDIPITYVED